MTIAILIPHDKLAALCRQYHIHKLMLFGSVLRDDFNPDSDVDVLVEFVADQTPGWEFFTLRDKLSELFGREVDLGTPNSLSPYIRDDVLASMQVIL